MRQIKWIPLAIALVHWMGCALLAQTPAMGQLGGVVRDPSGALVPGAVVTAANDGGVARAVLTGGDGRYEFPLLPPGIYRIQVTKDGFAEAVLEGIPVRITESSTVDVKLQLATRREAAEVVAQEPMVETESAARGEVIPSSAIRQLPLVTGNFQQLLTLTPGASGAINNSSDLGRGDAVFSVNGQRTLSNSIVLNGVDISSIGTGSTPNLAVPATDSLEEFIVQTNLYDAAQGRNAGSVVAAVTKSGSNRFNGSIYEFLRNTSLDAGGFFLNRAGIARPPYHRNVFGGDLGGPLSKDRAFFFVSYQGTREVNGTSLENSLGTAFVPGDLSNDRSLTALTALAASYGVPACGNAPSPTGCFSPTAQALLQAKLPDGRFVIPSAPHPVPVPAGGTPAAPVAVPVVAISLFREDQLNANLDVALSRANRLSLKAFGADNPETQGLYNSFGTGNALPVAGFGSTGKFDQRVLAADDTHAFKGSLLNDFRFGVSAIPTNSVPQEPISASQIGISSPLGRLFPGMPEISVANYFDLGASPFSDNRAAEMDYTVSDTLAWHKGRHTLRLGAEYKHHEVATDFNLYTRGQIFFLGLSGDPFRDFLGGFYDLGGLSIIGSGVNNRDALSYDLTGFAADTWVIGDRLTLNLGLRYEYFSPFTEAQGRYIGFDPSLLKTAAIAGLPPGDNVAVAGGFVQAANAASPVPGIPETRSSIVPPDKNNFAPRLGIAWQPFSGRNRLVVVRGGYGVYYDKPNSRYFNYQILAFPYYLLGQGVATPIATPFVQVPQPNQFPLAVNSPALFPYGGPPAFLPGPTGTLQPVSASGIYPDIGDFRTPYVQQYSLGIQSELGNQWVADVSYVGSSGRKLLRLQDANQPTAPSASAVGLLSPGLSSLVVEGFGFHLAQTSANSIYNSLQGSLSRRLANGLQGLISYTYSHSLDDFSGDASGTSDVNAVPGNQSTLNNRGSSDFDRRQRFVLSGVYNLPKLYRGSSGPVWDIANGWTLSAIVTIQSGTPFSVLTSSTAFVNARADWNPAEPNCAPAGSDGVESRLNAYFDVSCFAPATAPGDFGTTGRNILRGPAQSDVDLSAVKSFALGERTRFEFRTEFFNALNRPSFANPVNSLSSANVAQIVATSTGPRVIQLAAKVNF
jgi:hypothetical protein